MQSNKKTISNFKKKYNKKYFICFSFARNERIVAVQKGFCHKIVNIAVYSPVLNYLHSQNLGQLLIELPETWPSKKFPFPSHIKRSFNFFIFRQVYHVLRWLVLRLTKVSSQSSKWSAASISSTWSPAVIDDHPKFDCKFYHNSHYIIICNPTWFLLS